MIRSAARMTARAYLQSKHKLKTEMNKRSSEYPVESERAKSFFQNFTNNLKKAIEEEQKKGKF